MQFGMIPYDGLEEENFLFPEVEQPFLPGTKTKNPVIYIGLPNWTFKEDLKHKNSPYPIPGTLPFYSTIFNSVELNATHYVMPEADKIVKWTKSVEHEEFKFCPKFYKGITHTGNIDLHKMGITKLFINDVKRFKDKLGTSLLQVPENFNMENKSGLIEFLKALPNDFETSVELRNPNWFNDTDLLISFIKELNLNNKGLVISDSPGRRDAVHMHLSNPTAFIRFFCRGDNELDKLRISLWKDQLKSWYLQGLEKCFFFLHINEKSSEEHFIKYVQSELVFN